MGDGYGHAQYYATRRLCYGFVLLFAVITWTFYVYYTFYGKYENALFDVQKKFEKAATYLSSDVCKNKELRAGLENYNMCEESERLLNKNMNTEAIHMALSNIDWCQNGVCTVWGVNITGAVDSIASMMYWGTIILFFVSIYVIVSSTLGKYASREELPLTRLVQNTQQQYMAGYLAGQQTTTRKRQIGAEYPEPVF